MSFRSRPMLALAVLALLAVVGAVWGYARHRADAPTREPATAAQPQVAATVPPVDSSQSVTVPPRSNFVAAMAPFHLQPGLVQDMIRAAKPVHSLAQIKSGQTLTLERAPDGQPVALSYQIDDNHVLWLRAPAPPASTPSASLPATPAAASDPSWSASIQAIPYVTKLVGVSGTVRTSLSQAVEDAGEHDALAVKIANVFAYDLDFYTDTKPGDVFRVLVEKKYLNGKFSHYGQIVAAEYVNDGQAYDAVRFHDRFGELAYYRPNGEPMKREFLRSPLRFDARISSQFNLHRFNPVLKIVRPHLGTDFAAPTGTPVQTIGNGVVIHASWKGEDGRMVEIRHANGYNTYYLHLSKILVHLGQHVTQGQTIGLVGMSGLATGPNLHFAITYHGRFENFEVLRKRLPPGTPVPARLRPQFSRLKNKYMAELAALQPAHAAAPVATASVAR